MIQQIINFLYRYPKARLKQLSRFGGYWQYRKMMNQSAEMSRKSSALPPVESSPEGWPVYFLTGKKYLYQTLFCIQSLSRASKEKFQFHLVDDGTFDADLIERIINQLPGAVLVTASDINKNLSDHLPEARYPGIHHKRKVYPHIKKLTDIHTISGNSWKLVLDSDMLFWNQPVEMETWLKNPDRPLFMVDCADSYGYSYKLMEELSSRKLHPLINVGMIGLNSELLDWKKLENWVEELELAEGMTYYLEQALSAMIIGDTESCVLPQGKYIVNPSDRAITESTGVLHHYVDLSKKGYFNVAWKKILNSVASPTKSAKTLF